MRYSLLSVTRKEDDNVALVKPTVSDTEKRALFCKDVIKLGSTSVWYALY